MMGSRLGEKLCDGGRLGPRSGRLLLGADRALGHDVVRDGSAEAREDQASRDREEHLPCDEVHGGLKAGRRDIANLLERVCGNVQLLAGLAGLVAHRLEDLRQLGNLRAQDRVEEEDDREDSAVCDEQDEMDHVDAKREKRGDARDRHRPQDADEATDPVDAAALAELLAREEGQDDRQRREAERDAGDRIERGDADLDELARERKRARLGQLGDEEDAVWRERRRGDGGAEAEERDKRELREHRADAGLLFVVAACRKHR
mmetsp:Transcript_5118/g.13304  ORF Transcript_5118/g.13304 Transcript_5118/m.13304 type:complete len:261 (+) Transcript_5118:330-1112(+)